MTDLSLDISTEEAFEIFIKALTDQNSAVKGYYNSIIAIAKLVNMQITIYLRFEPTEKSLKLVFNSLIVRRIKS